MVSTAVRTAAVLLLPLVTAACEHPAVVWADAAPVETSVPSPTLLIPAAPMDSALADSAAGAAALLAADLQREATLRGALLPALRDMPEASGTVTSHAVLPAVNVAPAPNASLGSGDAPIDSARCARSLRMVTAYERGTVAAWWTRAAGGRVFLQAAWRDSSAGGAWRGPIPVDTLDQGPGDAQAADRGSHGCMRPAPSVVVDDKNGYVHVAYALTGPEGSGVFYAHQMDPRSGFEPPVAIVYGDKLGIVRVAAAGDVVAVAYEDPNSGARTQIGVAVSRTAGHLFEERLTASNGIMQARDPFIAAQGRGVIVGWRESGDTGGPPVFRTRRAIVK